jgi:hypothetical protein
MLLGSLPRDLRAIADMKRELDPRDLLTCKWDKLRKHVKANVLDKCLTANALSLPDLDNACMVPGVSPCSIPAVVPLLQMPVVLNLGAVLKEETPAPVHATEVIPIAKAENTIYIWGRIRVWLSRGLV